MDSAQTCGLQTTGQYRRWFGQDYNVAIIADMPGNAEHIGAIGPALMAGTFAAFRSIPLYTASEVQKASQIAKKVGATYRPPGK